MRVIAKEWAFQQAHACGFFFIPSLVSPRLDHMMASGVVGPTLDFDLEPRHHIFVVGVLDGL